MRRRLTIHANPDPDRGVQGDRVDDVDDPLPGVDHLDGAAPDRINSWRRQVFSGPRPATATTPPSHLWPPPSSQTNGRGLLR